MPFRFLNSQITQRKLIKYIRKEEDSAKTQSITSYFPKDGERASLFTSFKGSITVEASLVLPLFFFAVCCLCYLLEIMAIQMTVRTAAHSAGKEIAKEAYAVPLVLPSKVEDDIAELIGRERMDRSIIKGGSGGLDCSKTRISAQSGVLQMNVEYKVVLPFSIFGMLSLSCEEQFQIKGWTGYVKGGFVSDREDVVYITDTGLVYHRDYHCTYLELSIRMVAKDEVENLRNENHEKYYRCEKCGGVGNCVYITGQGNRYHSSLGCSGLKRSVYAVPVSEVQGKGACSRCGY